MTAEVVRCSTLQTDERIHQPGDRCLQNVFRGWTDAIAEDRVTLDSGSLVRQFMMTTASHPIPRMQSAQIIASHAAFGLGWGAALRAWMRLVSTDPHFSWAGTASIVVLCGIVCVLCGCARAAALAGARPWLAVPVRAVAIVGTFLLGFGPGVLLLPALTSGALATAFLANRRLRWVATGSGLVMTSALVIFTGNDLGPIRVAVAVTLLCGLLVPMSTVVANAYRPRRAMPSMPTAPTRPICPMQSPPTVPNRKQGDIGHDRQHLVRPVTTALVILLTSIALALGAIAVIGVPGASGATVVGHAELRLADGTTIGSVTFTNVTGESSTNVTAELSIPRNSVALRSFHGFHIHANDSGANGNGCIADPKAASATWFASADGHLKHQPSEVHGAHAGDMVPLHVNLDGTARTQFSIDRVQPGELFDRVVILHAGADNLGNIPLGDAPAQYRANTADANVATANTGNAGDRLACGVIEVSR